MIESVKKHTVQLFGESYVIVSDEPEADLLKAVDHYNQYMQVLVAESGIQDAKKIALLTGLHLSQELLRCKQREEIEHQIEGKVRSLIDCIDAELDFFELKKAAQVL